MLLDGSKSAEPVLFGVLVFIPDWKYNVDRKACMQLLIAIADMKGIRMVIKANTRGTGTLERTERDRLKRYPNVCFADIAAHSPSLIKHSSVVVNFASSIGIEAILQGKPVCHPSYLNGNSTIFDASDVVFNATDEYSTLDFISSLKSGVEFEQDSVARDRFHQEYVLGGSRNSDVLSDYLDLLTPD